ncbi:MAG: cbb3-type cytochrome oxidase assembly protein CcoS [Alphaproteobacteria bacterium]
MNVIVYRTPIALARGSASLAAFFWALKSDQFDDPDGAAAHVLIEEDRPLIDRKLH